MKSKKNNSRNFPLIIKMGVALLLLLFLWYAGAQRNNGHLERVSIKIKTRDDNRFLISKKEVKRLINDNIGYDLSIAKLRKIDLFKLEAALEADDRVNRAEIFIDKHNKLTVGIIQNLPIVRVSLNGREDYYLDADGSKIPAKGIGIRVPVVTGAVDKYDVDFKKKKDSNLNYVLNLSRLLYEDDFFSGLVDQIEISENDGIVLVPKMGRKKINLGTQESGGGLDEKMSKLKTYYEKGIKNIGIDRFDELDLQYHEQIIGRSNSES